MKKRIKNENVLMIVLAFMAFSTSIWSNYRQLWLKEVGYSISGISKILSVALICSSIIAFILSFFSAKIKVKNIVILSLVLRTISMIVLLFSRQNYIIKLSMLICIMCEVIFSISFYPLLSFESRKNSVYRRKMLIEYFSKDIGIILCGLLLGYSFGKFVFGYNECLLISLLATICSLIFVLSYKSSEDKIKKRNSFKKSLNMIFSSKMNTIFLSNQLICYISYGLVFDLMMLILTNYIGFSASFSSIFIIICNMFGTIFSLIFSKISKSYSVSLSAFIKYGSRAIFYLVAFFTRQPIIYIAVIIYAFITSRVLEDKVTGSFLTMIEEENQFLFGNIRYLAMTLGEGIGAYIAGILLTSSFNSLFFGASIVSIIQTIVFFYLSKLREEKLNH